MCADEGETPAYIPLVTDEFGYYKYPGSFYAIPQFSYFDVVGAHLATFTWWTPLGKHTVCEPSPRAKRVRMRACVVVESEENGLRI